MSENLDFDALVQAGALDEVDPVAARLAREDAEMLAEFQAAIMADVGIVIDMARAASEARVKEDARGPRTAEETEARRTLIRNAEKRITEVRVARIRAGQTASSISRPSDQ